MAEGLYWRRTRRLTFLLIVVWGLVTFGLSWLSDDLNEFTVFGFPLGFYMAAQGTLLVYLGLIWFYNWRMQKLDAELGIDDE